MLSRKRELRDETLISITLHNINVILDLVLIEFSLLENNSYSFSIRSMLTKTNPPKQKPPFCYLFKIIFLSLQLGKQVMIII